MSDYTPTEDHVRVAERCLGLRQDVSRLEVQHLEDTREIKRLQTEYDALEDVSVKVALSDIAKIEKLEAEIKREFSSETRKATDEEIIRLRAAEDAGSVVWFPKGLEEAAKSLRTWADHSQWKDGAKLVRSMAEMIEAKAKAV